MHAAISEKREELVALCRRYDVLRLEVFGSAAHGTDFDPLHSDADFRVEFRRSDGRAPLRQYFDFAKAPRHAMGRPVDLVEAGAVQNPYLRAAVDRSRELVHVP